jgi:oligopeptide/dipeptide ABC transporter ATP-binding protein
VTWLDEGAGPADSSGLLVVDQLVQEYRLRRSAGTKGILQAVAGVSFSLGVEETLGIVGETGCGKSTLARSIMQSPPPVEGSVVLRGTNLVGLSGAELRASRRHMQMVFQDPFSSVDPKWKVGRIIAEPMRGFSMGTRATREKRVRELMDLVGLDPTRFHDRHPRQLSGGQCQRVAVARALSTSPDVVICDEAVSSLDVLVQAQVLNLFESLRREFHLSYLFISHDLGVVRQVSDRVAVMYLGKFCEIAASGDLYRTPLHPYSAILLAATPTMEPSASGTKDESSIEIFGEPPSPAHPPSGCRFRTRCPYAQQRCAEEEPALRMIAPGRTVACHFPLAA